MRIRLISSCSWLASLALALASANARASPPDAGPRVELTVGPCAGVSAADVRRIAAIELHADAVEVPAHDEGTTRVDVSCDADQAAIRVVDPLTGKSLARSISLAPVPVPARSRLLALAIAELVSASWIELETNPEPVAEPVAPKVAPEERAAAREVARGRATLGSVAPVERPREATAGRAKWRLTGELATRWFAVDSSLLYGLGARLGWDPVRTVGLDLDLLAEHSDDRRGLGTVSLDSVSLGAVMRFRREMGPWAVRGGPGVRLGFARISGSPGSSALAVGGVVDGVWGGPIAAGSLAYTTARHVTLQLGLEAGLVVLPLVGVVEGGRDVQAKGFFSGATLGCGWVF